MLAEKFKEELNTIKNDDIRNFAIKMLNDAPSYFEHVAASSSGKYHPSYALGEGGLLRHTKAVLRIFNHIISLEQYNTLFTERNIDLGRVACLVHDLYKQGLEENQKNEDKPFTVFDHPFIAARKVLEYKDLEDNELLYIANCVASHMGQWNTSKYMPDVVLLKPESNMQKLVHLADYLASRKDIEIIF